MDSRTEEILKAFPGLRYDGGFRITSPEDTETPNPFLLMDAKEFLEEATGVSVDIVRNHQNLNPRLRKRILKDGIFIF